MKKRDKKGGMKKRRDSGLEGFSTGGLNERMDSGHVGFRTRGIYVQYSTVDKEGYRKGGFRMGGMWKYIVESVFMHIYCIRQIFSSLHISYNF